MRIDKRQFIEIVGILGVIASLLFVGMQLVLDRRVSLGVQYHARAESRMSTLRAELESEAVISDMVYRWESGIKPPWWNEELETEFESYPIQGLVVRIIQDNISREQIENIYFQYKQGLYPESEWQQIRSQLKSFLRQPLKRAVFPNGSAEWQNLLNELIAEIDSEQ